MLAPTKASYHVGSCEGCEPIPLGRSLLTDSFAPRKGDVHALCVYIQIYYAYGYIGFDRFPMRCPKRQSSHCSGEAEASASVCSPMLAFPAASSLDKKLQNARA